MKKQTFNKIRNYFLTAIISIFIVAITVLSTEVSFLIPVALVFLGITNIQRITGFINKKLNG